MLPQQTPRRPELSMSHLRGSDPNACARDRADDNKVLCVIALLTKPPEPASHVRGTIRGHEPLLCARAPDCDRRPRGLWGPKQGYVRQRQGFIDRDVGDDGEADGETNGDSETDGRYDGRARQGRLRLVRPLAALLLGASIGLGACERAEPPREVEPAFAPTERADVRALRSEEARLRAETSFRAPPDARGVLGPDPVALAALDDGGLAVLLQTPGELLVMDASGAEQARLEAPAGAAALAKRQDGTLLVGGPSSRDLWAYRDVDGAIVRSPERDVRDFAKTGVRALADAGSCLYGVDERQSELIRRCGESTERRAALRGSTGVFVSGSHIVVTSPLSHSVTVMPFDASGAAAVICNDGPIFTASAIDHDGALYVVSAGVEDHPLDRRGGSFGYIDSFVFVDRVEGPHVERIAAVNVGEVGVITPKALLADTSGDSLTIIAASYGSDAVATITLPLEDSRAEHAVPRVSVIRAAPGITALARTVDGELVGTSKLLDGVIHTAAARFDLIAPASVDSSLRAEEPVLRLGEALFFTHAMAPWQKSDGRLSRFTCETCHLDGGIDGRVHATGRGDVVATTKPLFGLLNNGPHFTRALDEDLAEMVFAEFRVAAANSGEDEWFDLEEADLPWTKFASWYSEVQHGPASLRRALMLYLARTPHPSRAPRPSDRFTDAERRGADLFEQRCAGCHAPRLVAHDPSSVVARDEWEPLVLSKEGPIVWARDGYEKTGVLPYVHPEGARPPSLRRIGDKLPYFTNGRARTLEEVVRGARFDETTFFHAGGPTQAESFRDGDVVDLVAFLELL